MDAADELARRALEIRDGNQARYAAGVAKAVEPLNEAGWRTALRAAMQDRDTDEINRIVDEMYARVGGGDPDYELDQLMNESFAEESTRLGVQVGAISTPTLTLPVIAVVVVSG